MPTNKPVRVVIDTNVWISFLISKRQSKLDSLLYINRIRFLFSSELLDEISSTVRKPKLKKYFAQNAMEEMLLNLEPYIDIIDVNSTVNVCRDPKDNFILALSKDGKAEYLITGDKDLLELETSGNTRIVTITKFIEAAESFSEE